MIPSSTVLFIAIGCLMLGALIGIAILALCLMAGGRDDEGEVPLGYEAGDASREVQP